MNAFGKLVKHNHDLNVTLVIIGDGSTRSILEQLVSSYDIEDRVIFAGYIPDAYRFLNAIDIFVLPSLSEGSPLCILEAMVSGRSIIASNIPAIEEILENGHDAILFNPSNPDQLEAAILTLYTNTEMRRKLMENAKKKSTRYDANVVFQRILQLYQSVNQTKHHLSKTSSNNERTFYAPSVDCATTLK
jgi:glycosyltransferase involved in cell wall biosynthesis